MKLLHFSSPTATVVFFALAYGLIYSLNNALTGFMYLLPGAHLVHIPSGFKLLFVLIGGPLAAMGIALVCLGSGLFFMFPGLLGLSLMLAAVNGLAPLVVLQWLSGSATRLPDLSPLNAVKFLQLGALFAVVNTSLNQMVLYWNGMTENFAGGMAVMFLGDLTGCYIVMLLIKGVGRLLHRQPPEEENPSSFRVSVKNMP